jgi:ABC-2 type transport system ATP-binding protein
MLIIDNVSYKIKGKQILKDISLELKEGERLALLGPNGAGKSSLIDIITGAIKPEKGDVKIMSGSFQKAKDQVGVLYEYVPLFFYSKVKEIIAYVCSVYDVKKSSLHEIIKVLEIDKIEDKLVKVLSKGERKKVGVLMTILHDPKLIILDEPTSDLDPFMRDEVWNFFLQEKRTVFFTTHLWEEAEKKAQKIAFIFKGQIIAVDSPDGFLSDRYLKNKKKIVLTGSNNYEETIKDVNYIRNKEELFIYPDNIDSFLNNHNLSNYSIADIDLKDVFLHLTKNL